MHNGGSILVCRQIRSQVVWRASVQVDQPLDGVCATPTGDRAIPDDTSQFTCTQTTRLQAPFDVPVDLLLQLLLLSGSLYDRGNNGVTFGLWQICENSLHQ